MCGGAGVSFPQKMGFLNAFLCAVRGSAFHIVNKGGVNRQFPMRISQPLLQCRMLMLTHCLKNQEKASPSEKLDLDTWKTILRSAAPKPESEECEEETQEESTIESMEKLVDMWRLAGKAVPDSISTEELQVLLKLATKSSRRKYLKQLQLKEHKKKNKQKKKLEKEQTKSDIEMEMNTEKPSSYFLKFWSRSEDCFDAWRGAQAMIFGQPLVFDMVYDRYMSQREMENTVSQLQMSEGFNRKSMEPFHIHFCNLKPNGPYHEELVKRYQGAWDNLLITATEKSHVDIFPKDRLVYLTADSPNVLKTYDHDKIYIIGAFVDKSQKTGVSLGNAKRLQLATARLPLDSFLKWNCGGKNLTLNNVIEILMTLRDTGDWAKGLSSVPTRKHHGFRERCDSSEAVLSNTKLYELMKKKATDQKKESQTDFAQQGPKDWWQEKD
ncbi:tRNA methyltransferase 10 homolog C [Bufo bufo]|uniref:tRNA methyltransferase 10 homolog C n=1 Tax=Bufo bufo TaxID=8384 RepID=UPI001ABDD562|nr:tRNA methyltransferase 10 homolog C [Bufo bufo]